ncbi:MAG: amino acid permease [Propionibacteriaceae bacterium]|nr:amino acid permease [Propionibacteriaceae bacterium]
MTPGVLARRLGTGDAIILGLGSMIGAGVFAVFAPAAQAAGFGLLAGLAVAAAVAYANAAASAQLAAAYPTSGGTYIYGRERLGEWWGFTAGWAFLVGKTASCAAMALTFATYLLPASGWTQRLLALAAVAALAAVNYRGIKGTARVARVLVAFTLACLGLVVTGIWLAPGGAPGPAVASVPGGAYGVLQAAGLLFFAFAGYARIATLGEEVREPRRTIPRAILGALAITVVVYTLVGWTALATLGPERLAASAAPLREAVQAAGADWLVPVVQAGAVVASLGALLTLLAGVGRTALAMARNADLPRWLATVHPTFSTPHRAEVALALVIGAVVLALDVRGAIGFSSFGVLVYYAIANAAALTQRPPQRRWPRLLNLLGLLGCVVLAGTLPLQSVLAGAAILGLGVVGRLVLRRA